MRVKVAPFRVQEIEGEGLNRSLELVAELDIAGGGRNRGPMKDTESHQGQRPTARKVQIVGNSSSYIFFNSYHWKTKNRDTWQ